MDDIVYRKFRHKLYTHRINIDNDLKVDTDGWRKEESEVSYGVLLLDEFRTAPDVKKFQYQHTNGDRIRFFPSRLTWKENVRHMAVAVLPADTDLSFSADRPWKDLVEWPLKQYEPDSYDFQILSLSYQMLAAHCDENKLLHKRVKNKLEDVEIEFCQEWLRLNYKPSKASLTPIIDHEFLRFVTCFNREDLAIWLNEPTHCLHWRGTYDLKTKTAMFKRSTKISGRNVRRCVTVKELMYQFFVDNFGGYESLYLDFQKCTHHSCCVNPDHYIKARKQSYNNCSKRRRLIDDHREANGLL